VLPQLRHEVDILDIICHDVLGQWTSVKHLVASTALRCEQVESFLFGLFPRVSLGHSQGQVPLDTSGQPVHVRLGEGSRWEFHELDVMNPGKVLESEVEEVGAESSQGLESPAGQNPAGRYKFADSGDSSLNMTSLAVKTISTDVSSDDGGTLVQVIL
jgi:hypothetical protein